MNSVLALIIQLINLYQLVLLIYIVATWLINFNIINTSNRFVYSFVGSTICIKQDCTLDAIKKYSCFKLNLEF